MLALRQAASPAPVDDATLRSAIVNVAQYYLRMAAGKTPAEMEELIWQHDSLDGVDHGESCAAFASLTLELAAQVVDQHSWVTGGTSYPWPLHGWADVRVDPNPASLGITSLLQDAKAHHRWHSLGSGYDPLPGDWVLFDGHVEVVTKYAGGVLSTIGGDSLPNFSVNAHEYRAPLAAQGVAGFVNNGEVPGAASTASGSPEHAAGGQQPRVKAAPAPAVSPAAAATGAAATGAAPASAAPASAASGSARAGTSPKPARTRASGDAAIPGMPEGAPSSKPSRPQRSALPEAPPGQRRAPAGKALGRKAAGHASVPRAARARPARTHQASAQDASAIPGLPAAAARPAAGRAAAAAAGAAAPSATAAAPSPAPYGRHRPTVSATPVQDTAAQQAFIGEVVPGAVAVQRRYGVPASVTIAQAIDESGWGRSSLATEDHNLFGIKGTGPAGSDAQPTHEFENGQSVMRTASFRVYHNAAESIDDHGKLLATSEYYRQPMAYRHDPNALAAALTGVYATDPDYGAKLIVLMRRYDLYHYDSVAPAVTHRATSHPAAAPRAARPRPSAPAGSTIPGLPDGGTAQTVSTSPAAPAPVPAPAPARAQAHAHVASAAPAVSQQAGAFETVSAVQLSAPAERQTPRASARKAARVSQYQPHIPPSVTNSFATTARGRLAAEEPLYRDVASHSGIRWELLAACDWMQCEAQARFSPVHGEKLGTANPDGTIYRTKSEALEQCADDLVALARAVYGIELTAQRNLSVRDLANVFAAFRWGGLLRLHRTSAMEFPYSVAGLTVGHINMRWPNIDDPNTPDKPGGRFRKPFGAVPIVLGLKYPATV